MAYGGERIEWEPVKSWLTDWDWLDDGWGENAINIWNEVREQCPVASTERYGRAFMPVTMEAVRQIEEKWSVSCAIWRTASMVTGMNARP